MIVYAKRFTPFCGWDWEALDRSGGGLYGSANCLLHWMSDKLADGVGNVTVELSDASFPDAQVEMTLRPEWHAVDDDDGDELLEPQYDTSPREAPGAVYLCQQGLMHLFKSVPQKIWVRVTPRTPQS